MTTTQFLVSVIEKDLIDLQTRGQKEQTTLIKQLFNEISNKLAATGDVNDTLTLVMAQANATKERVDISKGTKQNEIKG